MEFKFFVVLIYNIKIARLQKILKIGGGREKSKLKIERAPFSLSQSSELLKESSTNSCY